MLAEFFLQDENATVAQGRSLGRTIDDRKTGIIIYLDGSLGAGKTTLCRGILQAFGHSGAVKSPTYTLVEPYELFGISVYHFDLYRLGDPEELEFLGIRDYFDNGNVVLIEWPARGLGLIPHFDLVVDLKVVGEGRKLTIRAGTKLGEDILLSLR